jgi:hypothetical protein
MRLRSAAGDVDHDPRRAVDHDHVDAGGAQRLRDRRIDVHVCIEQRGGEAGALRHLGTHRPGEQEACAERDDREH